MREIHIFTKIRVFTSGSQSETLDVENFAAHGMCNVLTLLDKTTKLDV